MKSSEMLPQSSNATKPIYTLGQVREALNCCEPSPHIQVSDLSISYGSKIILNEVSLEINRGCITALIGPSGCGKTSFLSSLNRMTDLIPDCKVDGQIKFNGLNLRAPTLNVLGLRREVGMIFQRPNPFPMSIRKNIEIPLREHGFRDKSYIAEKIQKVLIDVGLWHEVHDRLDASALTLSGGQQQRLCIARALALEPSILLMDEPCSALDPISSMKIEELILELRGKLTVVIVTHNLAQAKRIANYAAFFWMTERTGKLIEFGRCHTLFESPANDLTAAYIAGTRG